MAIRYPISYHDYHDLLDIVTVFTDSNRSLPSGAPNIGHDRLASPSLFSLRWRSATLTRPREALTIAVNGLEKRKPKTLMSYTQFFSSLLWAICLLLWAPQVVLTQSTEPTRESKRASSEIRDGYSHDAMAPQAQAIRTDQRETPN